MTSKILSKTAALTQQSQNPEATVEGSVTEPAASAFEQLLDEAGIQSSPPTAPPDTWPYWLGLREVKGLRAKSIIKLLRHLETPEAIWQAPLSAFQHVFAEISAQKNWEALQHARKTVDVQRLAEESARQNIQLISVLDKAYPPLLRQTYDPPLVLFLKGRWQALVGNTLAIVGTRRMSDYGRKVTQRLIAELAPVDPVIVSGLAFGVDAQAHKEAMARGLTTVAVLASGLDNITPTANRGIARDMLEAGGALVSEYVVGSKADAYTFPERNRIIAGLSTGTLMIEGDMKSGALITARHALEENRAVFAVPGNIFSPGSQGCHQLLKDGARLVASAQDITQELNWQPTTSFSQPNMPQFSMPQAAMQQSLVINSRMANLSPEQEAVLACVGYDPTSIEAIQARCGLPAAQCAQALTMLELDGLIKPVSGAAVCRA